MSTEADSVKQELVFEREKWQDGPAARAVPAPARRVPGALVRRHARVPRRGRLLVGDDRRRRATRSAATGRPTPRSVGGITAADELGRCRSSCMQAMFIGMDPPKHDRIKALFQRGFTPKRIAEHEDEIRAITRDVLDKLDGRETCDLVTDVAQPVVSRVIGSFMGLPPGRRRRLGGPDEHDPRRQRPGREPRGRADRHGARRARGLPPLRRADRRRAARTRPTT